LQVLQLLQLNGVKGPSEGRLLPTRLTSEAVRA